MLQLALVFLHDASALNFCVHLNDDYVVLPLGLTPQHINVSL